ncbi:MAG: aspartate/glutamate racemase family protein [Chlamydiia bacterium]
MSSERFRKTIGIVGGAGPMASAYLYQTILRVCQKEYDSNDYNEFPQIVLISYPFARGNPDKIQSDLADCVKKLQQAQAGVVGLACNSFHGHLPDLSGVEFVHLIHESINQALSSGIRKALILSAPKTIDMGLYEGRGVECIYPSESDQAKVTGIIREIANGRVCQEQADILKQVILNSGFTEGVILACTELPLVHLAYPLSDGRPVIDTVEVLARSLVRAAH